MPVSSKRVSWVFMSVHRQRSVEDFVLYSILYYFMLKIYYSNLLHKDLMTVCLKLHRVDYYFYLSVLWY